MTHKQISLLGVAYGLARPHSAAVGPRMEGHGYLLGSQHSEDFNPISVRWNSSWGALNDPLRATRPMFIVHSFPKWFNMKFLFTPISICGRNKTILPLRRKYGDLA